MRGIDNNIHTWRSCYYSLYGQERRRNRPYWPYRHRTAVLTIAGIAALTGYWAIGAVTGVIAIAVAAVLLVTGTTQKCPINEAVGVDTTPEDTE